jgi:hypothetical protein
MANTLKGDSLRYVNRSGGVLNAFALIALNGFDTQTRTQQGVNAQANGTGMRADGIIDRQYANNRTGFYYTDYILEGSATSVVNTAAAAAGDPVFLSPTVAGGWTLTKPSAENQDIHEIGAVLTSHATDGIIRFNLQGGGARGYEAGFITENLLAQKPVWTPGHVNFGWIGITGAGTADGDRVTIGARVYEFDTAADPGAIGAGADVRVNVSGGAGAAASIIALAAAINGDATGVCHAVDIGGDRLALAGRVAGAAVGIVFTNTVDAGGTIDLGGPGALGGTVGGGANPVSRRRQEINYTFLAADVTDLALTLGTDQIPVGVWPNTVTPIVVSAQGITAAGVLFSLDNAQIDLVQVNANFWAALYTEPAGGALFAATDRLLLVLAGA